MSKCHSKKGPVWFLHAKGLVFFFLKGYEYQRINSIQKLKLLCEISKYDLYYYTTHPSSESSLSLKFAQTHITLYLIFIK